MKPLPMATITESSCCSTSSSSSCCSGASALPDHSKFPWITGTIPTLAGAIPVLSTTLTRKDILGAWKVRWGLGRNNYKVDPGLYALGTPTSESPVLVTANYKLTLDVLRREMTDMNAWIMVLDTKGINVWCAAGKGTFGTAEIVARIKATQLSSLVTHRTLILPQLGAPGVSAHEVARLSGFKVIYGPVRADDVKTFIQNGMTAAPEMRRVQFTTRDRLELTPVELVPSMKTTIFFLGLLFILNSLGMTRFNGTDVAALLGAVFAGAVLSPMLLPWLPGRMFSIKGAFLGLLWAVVLIATTSPGTLSAAAYMLLLPAISSFLAMNFTGASTYTSFSGVKKEMTLSVPPMLISGAIGIVTLLIDAALRLPA